MTLSPYPLHRSISAAEARGADRRASEDFALPSLVLMEHAGRGLASLVQDLPRHGRPVVVVCGPGNNGGDGYACARFLSSWGVPVRVIRASPSAPASPDARLEHDLAARDVEILAPASDDVSAVLRAFADTAVIVDALFGIGLTRPLAEPYVRWIEWVNAVDCRRVAADVPSGLEADSGVPLPIAVRADATAAMGMPKRGCFTTEGAPYAGDVVEIDIGLPAAIHREFLA